MCLHEAATSSWPLVTDSVLYYHTCIITIVNLHIRGQTEYYAYVDVLYFHKCTYD